MAKKQKVLDELGYTSTFNKEPKKKSVKKPAPGTSQGGGAKGSKRG